MSLFSFFDVAGIFSVISIIVFLYVVFSVNIFTDYFILPFCLVGLNNIFSVLFLVFFAAFEVMDFIIYVLNYICILYIDIHLCV